MKFPIVIIIFLILAGCATITRGMKEEVTFTSDADSVEVWMGDKNIGYTPISIELWKTGKKITRFRLPNGQEYSHRLETHITPAFFNNLILIFNPTMSMLGFCLDLLTGAGKSFEDETFTVEYKKTGERFTIHIIPTKKRGENYILVSCGMGFGHIEREEKKKQLFIPEMYFELIRSYRDVVHYGFGVNPGYFKEKDRTEVVKMDSYLLFKLAPRADQDKVRVYFLGHAGGGTFWTSFEEGEEWSNSYFYFALGLGMEFNEKIYSELLLNGYWNDCIKMPDSSVGFRVGYRFNL